ncbi:DUF3445 domain-containing protein [Albimonas sp. CAU 1670]|uniref:heme-dependent oxidative N-demethylase family protein n=1 Tax=Albimonas sp. CAU 1670 TaxID=3032599 RepID=UPI0023DA4954|nr:DUF3445 domain-containing protein [Albimonas sp. CAU 1670]MDF2234240.1 DUF3445 domain-containing protein [Albimonas sp. CAU 1670]
MTEAPSAAAAPGHAAPAVPGVLPPWALPYAPVAPFANARVAVAPGIQPLDPAEWFLIAEDFAGQMAERDRLIADHAAWAYGTTPEGEEAAAELLETIAEHVVARHGFTPDGPRALIRPDGVRVALDDLPPIAAAGRLVQDDLLLMARPEGAEEHVLVAGVLCFPAHWTLSEKLGRPLLRIHMPVPEYPGDLARRVQRFFDGVQPGRPIWRANWHFAAHPEIVTPMPEAQKTAMYRERLALGEDAWLRVERQTVLRLPRTRAALFGVRTLITPADGLSPAQWRALDAVVSELPAEQGARKLGPALRARAAREAAKAD